MESNTFRDVRDLAGDEKRSLETLLRQPLEEGQRVFIMTFRPGVEPSEANRQRSHAALIQTLDETHRHAQEQSVTSAEADAAVEDAMRQARPRSS
jgi:hypothetical protein